MAEMGNVTLQWMEPQRARLGAGVSRPKDGQKARPYTLLVRQRGERPMKVTLAAPSKQAAIRYGQNRWPGAEVEVL